MTLLVALRKLRHPIVVDELKKNTGSWYALGSMKNTSFRMNHESDMFYLEYSTGQFRFTTYRKYFIHIGRESLSLRILEWQRDVVTIPGKEIANITDLMYNNDEVEALMFQMSLSNDLHQFGINEYHATVALCEKLLR